MMPHIEMPVKPDHHLTLVHFHRTLTKEQGEIVLNGVEDLLRTFGAYMVDMYWGFDMMVGPPGNQQKASGVEFGTDAVVNFQHRLKDGLARRGLPVSNDFGPWLPHVTAPPLGLEPWSVLRPKGTIDLVQGQFRVPVPMPAPVA